MKSIKVTVEKDGKSVSYSGEFAVVGIIRDDGDEKEIKVATSGGATAYSAAMLGCQVVAKMVEPFDAMEPVRPEARCGCREALNTESPINGWR